LIKAGYDAKASKVKKAHRWLSRLDSDAASAGRILSRTM